METQKQTNNKNIFYCPFARRYCSDKCRAYNENSPYHCV